MADILHDSSDNLSFSGGSGRNTWNLHPDNTAPNEPYYIQLESKYGYKEPYIEDVLEAIGDLIIDHLSEDDVYSGRGYDDEGFLEAVNHKAIDGSLKSEGSGFSGKTSFWIFGRDLAEVYRRLEDAYMPA